MAHVNADLIFEKHALPHFRAGMDVLELGGVYTRSRQRRLLAERGVAVNYHFADLKNLRGQYPGYLNMTDENRVDSPGERFDIVFSLNAMEHVRKPWLWVREIHRLLKTGGLMIVITPVFWQQHTTCDCYRYFPDGARSLLEEAGCDEVLVQMETLDTSEESRRHQHGQGAVVDLITMGRKK